MIATARTRLLALLLILCAAAPALADGPRRYPADRAIDIATLSLDLDVDLEGASISGRCKIRATVLARSIDQVVLDAVDLEVSEATVNGRSVTIRSTGEELVLVLPEPVERGAELTIEIAYAASPKSGLHFFGPTESEPYVPLQVWSQNETLGARHWIPCLDNPEERQKTSITVRTRPGFEVISNGAMRGKGRGDDGRATWVYENTFEHPIYLVVLVIGEFHTERDTWTDAGGREVPLAYHVPKGRAADTARTFDRTKAMLDFMSERFGLSYPYVKYDQVVIEQFNFGGMENTGATTLNERTLHDARAHLDMRSDGLIAHELGHQWFGDWVTCRDWTHIWLNEGFASFSEACWDEHRNGADAYLENMIGKSRGAIWGGRNTPLVRRSYGTPDETFRGGTYPKGAFVLHMLREELGADDFWRGIREYLADFAAKPAETADLRKVFERVTGRSLGRFFYQWTERAGHPVLDVKVGWLEKEKLLSVTITQTQDGEPFEVTLPLAIHEAGAEGGAARRVDVPLTGKTKELLLPLAARPRFVSVDPGFVLLKELKLRADRDQLLAQLREAPSLIGRHQALLALDGQKQEEVRRALAAALVADASGSVREAAADALGKLPGDEVRDALLAALRTLGAAETGEGERGPYRRARARRAIVGALGSRRDDPLVRDTLLAVAETEPSYRVLASLASHLRGHTDPASFKLLHELLHLSSHNQQVERSALEALRQREELEALDLIEPFTERPTHRSMRAPALRALATFAARKDLPEARREAIVEQLAAALTEDSIHFRRAAADALRAIGDVAEPSLQALDALAKNDPEGRVRDAAKRAAEAIRKRETPTDQQVEALRAELRAAVEQSKALEERLRKVEAGRHGGKW